MQADSFLPSVWGTQLLTKSLSLRPVRTLLRDILKKRMHLHLVKQNPLQFPAGVQQDKYALISAVVTSIEKGLDRGLIGPIAQRRLAEILVGKIYIKSDPRFQEFTEEYGWHPPGFITLSPTARCNLTCPGCYAASAPAAKQTLPYPIVQKILQQKMELWGSHFMVISGGEPFTYESEGKGMLDIFEEFSDQFFLVYTNGTKLSPRVAERLGELGNVTPAISVEGLEAETDARRGKGTFAKILKAMENLRRAGVPFGVSATATRATAEKILNDEFVEFFLEKQGALYSWVFQYMPIGRGYDVEMMLTPEQRVALLHRTWKLIREKEYFIADFWNCATASSGCIAAGGGIGGGYFYIDWNGNVAPCVFNPVFVDNIAEVFARGGDLNSVIFSPLFKKVRCWQRSYFLDRPAKESGNLFAPCLMRDHHEQMRQIVAETKATPLDADTACAFQDAAYYQAMVQYGQDMGELTHDLWRDFRDGQPSRESKRKSLSYQDKTHSGNEKRNSFQSQASIPS